VREKLDQPLAVVSRILRLTLAASSPFFTLSRRECLLTPARCDGQQGLTTLSPKPGSWTGVSKQPCIILL